MSPPTSVRPRRSEPAGSVLRHTRPVHLLMVAAAIVVLVLLARFLDEASFIERISFDNPTPYDLSVEVSDGSGDVRIAVGTARRNETTILEEVFDVGDAWVFRFGAQGQDGGQLRLTRSQLIRDKWQVDIPKRVGAQLRALGAPPSD